MYRCEMKKSRNVYEMGMKRKKDKNGRRMRGGMYRCEMKKSIKERERIKIENGKRVK